MEKKYFVREGSVVRQIWGSSDMILFIFAGGAAEFALNKAVDWLYFTGKLPADPVGRLFSTVSYAQKIVFSEYDAAVKTIRGMAGIHSQVEEKRGYSIPDWAYRDVLYMLIDYSIRSFEIFQRKLTEEEKEEIFQVFHQLGSLMKINGLPSTYSEWVESREQHLKQDLQYSTYSSDLFQQYRKHLGPLRYLLLLESQRLIAPKKVTHMLGLQRPSFLRPILGIYRFSRKLRLDSLLRKVALPAKYRSRVSELEYPSGLKIQSAA